MLNWVVGPALMFALAWLLLPDLPEYRTGLIVVGLARCIAMVNIWNDLACGDREAAAVLVALNSVFQVIAFAALGWFYLDLLPGLLGLPTADLDVSPWQIAGSVLVFLGVPLIAGYLTRLLGERTRGRDWYESRFLPRIGPLALHGLLFTIVVLFALQGDAITSRPLDVARIALPLLAYFALMWAGSYALGRVIGLGYGRTTTLAFTAAGNNFELAIAVAIATFGVTSGQALAGVLTHASTPSRRPTGWRSPMSTATPRVLFVCVRNGGKSQMAAGLLRRDAGDRVHVHCAGTAPGVAINALSAQSLAEVGVDLDGESPKPIDPELLRRVDLVVTLGREATVDAPPGTEVRNWDVDEPSGRGIDGIDRMRLVRDDIATRVHALLAELAPPPLR